MSGHWGEFFSSEDQNSGNDEALPGEIVKFFVMQAMKQDPYRTPPPHNNAGSSNELELINNETLGLDIDNRVIHTIKLMQHAREMQQLIEAANEQTELLAESQIPSLPPASEIPDHPVPSFRNSLNFPMQYLDKEFSEFTLGKGDPLPEITSDTAKRLLMKSVAALLAHAGFETTTESVLTTAVDAAETYLKKMVALLRVAVDQGSNVGATGFPDAMERVFTEMRIGSVRELHTYYQDRIVKHHERMLEECRSLNLVYCSVALNVKTDVLSLDNITFRKLEEPDDVPEIHFPSMGDDGVDELQPSLEPGFQMLHSLEQEVQLQTMESQEEGGANDSPGQESFDLHLQIGRKRKRL